MRSFRVGSDATVSLEPRKSAVVPSSERQHERRARTIRAWTAIVVDDFRALTRGVLEHALEIVESGLRDFSTMKAKLLLWFNEATRGELTQTLFLDVALHGPAGTPAEMPVYQQAYMVSRLKLDDLQTIQFDEIPQYLAFSQSIRGGDVTQLMRRGVA